MNRKCSFIYLNVPLGQNEIYRVIFACQGFFPLNTTVKESARELNFNLP